VKLLYDPFFKLAYKKYLIAIIFFIFVKQFLPIVYQQILKWQLKYKRGRPSKLQIIIGYDHL
jgi:hypothetical protein